MDRSDDDERRGSPPGFTTPETSQIETKLSNDETAAAAAAAAIDGGGVGRKKDPADDDSDRDLRSTDDQASDRREEDDEERGVKAVDHSPDGRFLKFDEELGRGSFKTVYKGLDTETGVAVAWCELQTTRLRKSDKIRFREEVAILKSLQHSNILKFHESWEVGGSTITGKKLLILVTELMTSGTLKTYLSRFKKINIRIMRRWCGQILHGLHFLHTRTPPIIHRDLKCDNIFITGPSGLVKIGDLGLATLKHGSFVSSVIGTPEFMAPEMYEEKYDEKVDVYAFGMCLLEMATNEYPYGECQNAAQIYKKVTSGFQPDARKKVENPLIAEVIDKCINYYKEKRYTISQLLAHQFFTTVDEPDEDIKVEIRNQDQSAGTIGLLLIGDKKGKSNIQDGIQIAFNLTKDTPESVAEELCQKQVMRIKPDKVKAVAASIRERIEEVKRMQMKQAESAGGPSRSSASAAPSTASAASTASSGLGPEKSIQSHSVVSPSLSEASMSDSGVSSSLVTAPVVKSGPNQDSQEEEGSADSKEKEKDSSFKSPPLVERSDSINQKKALEMAALMSENMSDALQPQAGQQDGSRLLRADSGSGKLNKSEVGNQVQRSESMASKSKGKVAKGKRKLVFKEMTDMLAICVLHAKNSQIVDFQFSTVDDLPDEVAQNIVDAGHLEESSKQWLVEELKKIVKNGKGNPVSEAGGEKSQPEVAQPQSDDDEKAALLQIKKDEADQQTSPAAPTPAIATTPPMNEKTAEVSVKEKEEVTGQENEKKGENSVVVRDEEGKVPGNGDNDEEKSSQLGQSEVEEAVPQADKNPEEKEKVKVVPLDAVVSSGNRSPLDEEGDRQVSQPNVGEASVEISPGKSPLDTEGERQVSRFVIADADEANIQSQRSQGSEDLAEILSTMQKSPPSPTRKDPKTTSILPAAAAAAAAAEAVSPPAVSSVSTSSGSEKQSPGSGAEQPAGTTTAATGPLRKVPPSAEGPGAKGSAGGDHTAASVATVQALIQKGVGKQGLPAVGEKESSSPTHRASTSRESSIGSVPESELERLQQLHVCVSPSETPCTSDSEGDKEMSDVKKIEHRQRRELQKLEEKYYSEKKNLEGRHQQELDDYRAKKESRTRLHSRSTESFLATGQDPPKDRNRQQTKELEKREIERFESNPKTHRPVEQKEIAKHLLASAIKPSAIKPSTIKPSTIKPSTIQTTKVPKATPCEPKQTLKQLQEQKHYHHHQQQQLPPPAPSQSQVSPHSSDSVEWTEFSSLPAQQQAAAAANFVNIPVHTPSQPGASYFPSKPSLPQHQTMTVNKPEESTLDEFDPYRPVERKS